MHTLNIFLVYFYYFLGSNFNCLLTFFIFEKGCIVIDNLLPSKELYRINFQVAKLYELSSSVSGQQYPQDICLWETTNCFWKFMKPIL